MALTPPKTAKQLVDLYYADMRSHVLELAAALDRVERAGGSDEPRVLALRRAAHIALDDQPDRARRFLEELSV